MPSEALRRRGVRSEFSLYDFGRPGSTGWRGCRSAISGDECDPAIFLSTPSPMTSRRTDELVGKRITSDIWNLAAVFAWIQRKATDRIRRVARQVGEPGILINPEVIKPSARDDLDLANWIEGNRIHLHSHEELLCRSGVIDISAFRRILNAVDTR